MLEAKIDKMKPDFYGWNYDLSSLEKSLHKICADTMRMALTEYPPVVNMAFSVRRSKAKSDPFLMEFALPMGEDWCLPGVQYSFNFMDVLMHEVGWWVKDRESVEPMKKIADKLEDAAQKIREIIANGKTPE